MLDKQTELTSAWLSDDLKRTATF